jgi:hypothetical protein
MCDHHVAELVAGPPTGASGQLVTGYWVNTPCKMLQQISSHIPDVKEIPGLRVPDVMYISAKL